MYEIRCESCGDIGFHPSGTGAEIAAEAHYEETGHECTVQTLGGEAQ